MGGCDFSLYTVYKQIKVKCLDTVHTIALKLWEDVENIPGEVSALKTFSNSQRWRPGSARFVFSLYTVYKSKSLFRFHTVHPCTMKLWGDD